jgi:hypothetical protein
MDFGPEMCLRTETLFSKDKWGIVENYFASLLDPNKPYRGVDRIRIVERYPLVKDSDIEVKEIIHEVNNRDYTVEKHFVALDKLRLYTSYESIESIYFIKNFISSVENAYFLFYKLKTSLQGAPKFVYLFVQDGEHDPYPVEINLYRDWDQFYKVMVGYCEGASSQDIIKWYKKDKSDLSVHHTFTYNFNWDPNFKYRWSDQ